MKNKFQSQFRASEIFMLECSDWRINLAFSGFDNILFFQDISFKFFLLSYYKGFVKSNKPVVK